MNVFPRVRMNPGPETIGGPGTRGIEAIVITVDDTVINDIVCFVPVQSNDFKLAKARAGAIITALNMPAPETPSQMVDPIAAPPETPAPIAAAEHEQAIKVSGEDARVAALELGVCAAIFKLHETIMGKGTPLNPVTALAQFEDCLMDAGIEPPPRPEGWEALPGQQAANQWASGQQSALGTSGHAMMAASTTMTDPGGRRTHDVGVEYRSGGMRGPARLTEGHRREWPSKGVLHRAEGQLDAVVRKGDVFESREAQRAAETPPPVDNDHVAEGATQFTSSEIAQNRSEGYKPRDDASGLSEHIQEQGKDAA